MPLRVDLTREEIHFERHVRQRYLEIFLFWDDSGKYDRDSLWELWGLAVRAAYQQTGADITKLTPDMMRAIARDAEQCVQPTNPTPEPLHDSLAH